MNISTYSKATKTRWYCELKKGNWPDDLPVERPRRWNCFTIENRQNNETAKFVMNAVASQVSPKDLAIAWYVLFADNPMNVDEFSRMWENGEWYNWGTRMAA